MHLVDADRRAAPIALRAALASQARVGPGEVVDAARRPRPSAAAARLPKPNGIGLERQQRAVGAAISYL